MARERIGIALGSGSARGWAHIGVLRELEERGLRFDVVCGSSIGALVGAAYASKQLDVLEPWVRKLERLDVLRLLDASLRGGGVFLGARVFNAIRDYLEDLPIEDLPRAYGAVATNLSTGQEVWLREGSMLEAARASSGIPGLLAPVSWRDKWLVDGGLVNPVPVSLCRALGADRVIAVNLNAHLFHAPLAPPEEPEEPGEPEESPPSGDEGEANPFERATHWLAEIATSLLPEKKAAPGLFDVMGASINIMQDRITRSRMVGDPPDLLVEPRLGHLDLLDFHRADEAITAGRESVRSLEAQLVELDLGTAEPASERP